MTDWVASERKLAEFFAEWHIPIDLLPQLSPLQTDDPNELCLDLFYPGEVVPFAGDWRWWAPLLPYGLLPIGNCPNADFIAVDWKQQVGAVVYVTHDEFDTAGHTAHDMSEISVRVASSVEEFIGGLRNDTMPLDYNEAEERVSNNEIQPTK